MLVGLRHEFHGILPYLTLVFGKGGIAQHGGKIVDADGCQTGVIGYLREDRVLGHQVAATKHVAECQVDIGFEEIDGARQVRLVALGCLVVEIDTAIEQVALVGLDDALGFLAVFVDLAGLHGLLCQ